jgi:hypothetical protein
MIFIMNKINNCSYKSILYSFIVIKYFNIKIEDWEVETSINDQNWLYAPTQSNSRLGLSGF